MISYQERALTNMNICIVGYGAIGPAHAEAISSIDNATLYAICDIDKARADEGALKHNCKAIYSFEECLSDENIESVHICTPHYLHFEMITKAIDSGKSVVAEKPITMTKDEFSRLYLEYKNAPIFPIIQNRTNHSIKTLKEIIDTDKSLGNLKSVKGILTWFRDKSYYDSALWRGTKEYEGGGVLINQAIHTLDLMIYLGGKISSVTATTSNKSLKEVIEVEDTVDAYLKYENGARGIFYATNAYSDDSPVLIELEFENASFKYTSNKLYRNDEFLCSDETKFIGKSYWGSGHERTLYDLYTEKKLLGLDDIKNTMDTVFAIYESAELGKEITL